jgi:hypothetical protein
MSNVDGFALAEQIQKQSNPMHAVVPVAVRWEFPGTL